MLDEFWILEDTEHLRFPALVARHGGEMERIMQFICYKKCSTCAKARRWLWEHNINFTERDIKSGNPTVVELRFWQAVSNLPLKSFFNTGGTQYQEQNIKDQLPNMTDDDTLSLLATDGMLVKRPILVGDNFVLLGFNQDQWEKTLAEVQS